MKQDESDMILYLYNKTLKKMQLIKGEFFIGMQDLNGILREYVEQKPKN